MEGTSWTEEPPGTSILFLSLTSACRSSMTNQRSRLMCLYAAILNLKERCLIQPPTLSDGGGELVHWVEHTWVQTSSEKTWSLTLKSTGVIWPTKQSTMLAAPPSCNSTETRLGPCKNRAERMPRLCSMPVKTPTSSYSLTGMNIKSSMKNSQQSAATWNISSEMFYLHISQFDFRNTSINKYLLPI